MVLPWESKPLVKASHTSRTDLRHQMPVEASGAGSDEASTSGLGARKHHVMVDAAVVVFGV